MDKKLSFATVCVLSGYVTIAKLILFGVSKRPNKSSKLLLLLEVMVLWLKLLCNVNLSRLIPRGVERYAIKNFFSWLWKWGMSLLKLHFLQASSKRFGKWCEMARVTIKPILPFIFMKFWFFMSSSVEREALKSLLKSHKGNRRELFPLHFFLLFL